MIKFWRNYWFDPEFKRRRRFLKRISFFKDVSRQEFGQLFQALAVRQYMPGEILFKEGDAGRALFILESGKVEITRQDSARQPQVLALLHSGDFFGEMSLLDDLPRTASARALESCRVYLLYKTELDALMRQAPRLGCAILGYLSQLLAQRLRLTMERRHSTVMRDEPSFVEEVL